MSRTKPQQNILSRGQPYSGIFDLPASQADQDTLDTFDTIYDVVPLSLVAVKPIIKVNGSAIATGSASTTLGEAQSYTMEFNIPTRVIGSSVGSEIVDTINRSVITGNTDAIALDTDRVTPPELRPSQDTETTSFVNNQVLYKTGVDFLYRLESTQGELARVIGSDFTDTATRATIFNGIDITYTSSSVPYSFDWKGLRIDSSSKVRYFNRFNQDTAKYQKEFSGIFGLQASQDESDIFEDNFQVESVATVKGLKLVSSGAFSGITLHKITSANENDIDSLSISTATKNVFHTAVQAGKTVYTPSAPVTYGEWQGLFYISIDFNGNTSGYIIGEGLNGGYTVEEFLEDLRDLLTIPTTLAYGGSLTADISVNSSSITLGQTIVKSVSYALNWLGNVIIWNETSTITTAMFAPGINIGTITLGAGYGATSTVSITVNGTPKIGSEHPEFDDLIIDSADRYEIPRGILKAIIHKETQSNLFDPKTSRYEPKRDFQNFSGYDAGLGYPTEDVASAPFSYYTLKGINSRDQIVPKGTKIDLLKRNYSTTLKDTDHGGWQLREIVISPYAGAYLTVTDLYTNDYNLSNGARIQGWPPFSSPSWYTGDFTPQFLLSSSYGLGHVMYLEATQARNPQDAFIMSDNDSPHDIVDNIGLGIELAASILKLKFVAAGGELIPNDNCAGWSDAIEGYNSDPTYMPNVCKIYRKNYQ